MIGLVKYIKRKYDYSRIATAKGCVSLRIYVIHGKFYKTTLLPRKAFYRTLSQQYISKEDYAHARAAVWNKFRLRKPGDYHDLYVMRNVLLLADVFPNSRKLCAKFYQVDYIHFVTASGFAW